MVKIEKERKRIVHKIADKRYKESIYGKSRWLAREYNITKKEYDKLYQEQNGQCAICGKICKSHFDLEKKNIKIFNIDHSYKSGKVRGLLCNKCNLLLGYCEDNIEILLSAIKYLKKNKLEGELGEDYLLKNKKIIKELKETKKIKMKKNTKFNYKINYCPVCGSFDIEKLQTGEILCKNKQCFNSKYNHKMKNKK